MTAPADVRNLLFDALIDEVIRPGQPGAWRSALPYLKDHTAEHAADAGRLDELLADPEFLVHANPVTLARELHHARSPEAKRAASIHRTSFSRHRDADPEARRQILAVDAARLGENSWAQQLLAGSPWGIAWATGGQTSSALAATFTDHPATPTAVACATVGNRATMIVGTANGDAHVWDLATGQVIGELVGHTDAISAVAIGTHAERPVAATAGRDGTAHVWDLITMQAVRVLTAADEITAIALSTSDERTLVVTGGYDEVATVWDLAEELPVRSFEGHTSVLSGACVTTFDDARVAVTVGNDGIARVWHVDSGEPVSVYVGHRDESGDNNPGWISGVSVAAVDSVLVGVTAGIDGIAHVWDLATGATRTRYLGHRLPPGSDGVRLIAVAVTPIGGRPAAVTTASDGTVHVWDLVTARTLNVLAGHTGGVTSVDCTVLHGAPVAVTASDDGSVRVWDLAAETEFGAAPDAVNHSGTVRSVALVGDDRAAMVSAGDDSTARLWDRATGTPLARLAEHTGPVRAVDAISLGDGRVTVVTVSADRTAVEWDAGPDLRSAQPVRLGEARRDPVTAVACASLPDRTVAVIAVNDRVEVWDLETRQIWASPASFHTTPIKAMAAAHVNGRTVILSASDEPVAHVWDPATGRSIANLVGHDGPVLSVAFAVTGGLPIALTGGADHKVLIHDLFGAGSTESVLVHDGPVRALACIDDGEKVFIVSADGCRVRVSDLNTRRDLGSFEFPYAVTALCAAAPDGLVVATGHEVVSMTWDGARSEAVPMREDAS